MKEEPQTEPVIHLPPMPKHPSLQTFPTEPSRQLPVITPEAPPAEPEVLLQTLRQCLQHHVDSVCMQTSKYLLWIPQPLDSWETCLSRQNATPITHHSSQHLAENVITALPQDQLQRPKILQATTYPWKVMENSKSANILRTSFTTMHFRIILNCHLLQCLFRIIWIFNKINTINSNHK